MTKDNTGWYILGGVVILAAGSYVAYKLLWDKSSLKSAKPTPPPTQEKPAETAPPIKDPFMDDSIPV